MTNTTQETEDTKFKGFDLSEFSDEDKAKAIIEHLDLDGETDTIEEEYDGFSVNPRKVKRGNSPEQYRRVIEAFKKLLTKRDIEEIGGYIALGFVSKETRDKLYYKIEKKLKAKEDTPEAQLIKKDSLYVQNVLYHLLDTESLNESGHGFIKSYREAWQGKKVVDRREYSNENDGEYAVLSDSEADQRADDYLDEDYWKQAVEAGNTTEGFSDWKETVISNDGRGSIISGYDGCEHEVDVDGTTYYIYRTN